MHSLLELFTQSKQGKTDSTGDSEEYKSKTVLIADALFALLLSVTVSLVVWVADSQN